MSRSPFTRPAISAFSGIAGKLEMVKTLKGLIDTKKMFIDGVKNSVDIKKRQIENEIKDKAIKEARERGKPANDVVKRKRNEAASKLTGTRSINAQSRLDAQPIASIRNVNKLVQNDGQLNELKRLQGKLTENVASAAGDIEVARRKLSVSEVELRQTQFRLEDIEGQLESRLNRLINRG
jgi:hypothetical protein